MAIGAPQIVSWAADSGVAIDNPATTAAEALTLAGTAAANATIDIYDAGTLLGQTARQCERGLELQDRPTGGRRPRLCGYRRRRERRFRACRRMSPM